MISGAEAARRWRARHPEKFKSQQARRRIRMKRVGAIESGNLNSLAAAIKVWQKETFPKATLTSTAEHLMREAKELHSAAFSLDVVRRNIDGLQAHIPTRALVEDVADELCDVFHLLVAVAEAAGIDLGRAVADKFAVNLGREWGEPDEQGVVEHVEKGVEG